MKRSHGIDPNLARYRELTAPGRELNVFESLELETLETQLGQQSLFHHQHMKTKAKPSKAPKSTAPAPSAPQPGEQIVRIPLVKLAPSPWNRTWFDPEKLQELAASIRTQGILEPLLVRPMPTDAYHFEPGTRSGKPCWFAFTKEQVREARERGCTKGEVLHFPTEAEARAGVPSHQLVAGERRWRGADIAKLADAPCIVRDLTDKEAIEIQKVENLQREDVDPIEEGQGLRQMMREFGYTIEDIITRLGRSRSHIYGRIKLGGICAKAAELYRKGIFSESAATRIARLPGEEMQMKLIEHFADGWESVDAWADAYDEDAAITDDDMAWNIQQNFMRELKGSSFDQKDATLVPVKLDDDGVRIGGGACTDCPMRAGNQPDFDPHNGRADMCLNPSCFREKAQIAFDKASAKAVKKGAEIATEELAAGVFDEYGRVQYNQPLQLAEHTTWAFKLPGHDSAPSFAEAAKHFDIPVVLALNPRTGRTEHLVNKETVIAAAKAAGLKIKKDGGGGGGGGSLSASEREALAENKIKATVRAAQLTAIEKQAADLSLADLENRLLPWLRIVIAVLADRAGADTCRLTCKRREIDAKAYATENWDNGQRKAIAALGRNAEHLHEIIAVGTDLVAALHLYGDEKDPLTQIAELMGVDLTAVEKEVRSEKVKPAKKSKREEVTA